MCEIRTGTPAAPGGRTGKTKKIEVVEEAPEGGGVGLPPLQERKKKRKKQREKKGGGGVFHRGADVIGNLHSRTLVHAFFTGDSDMGVCVSR